MAISFDRFVDSLPAQSQALLTDVAHFILRKSAGVLTLRAATMVIASTIPSLSRAEAEGLAYCGLKVLETENAQMIKPQINMQRENLIFTSVSNVLKLRHDTAKNSIGNVR